MHKEIGQTQKILCRGVVDDEPRLSKNYVLASGKMNTVREFLQETLKCAKIDIILWVKMNEKFMTKDDNELIIEIDPSFYRPAEVHKLRGDCSLGKKNLVGNEFTILRNL